MIKGKTKSGFEYKLSEKRLNNYELLEAIAEIEEDPLIVAKVVNLLLGKEQTSKLKDHVRTKDGLVSTDRMTEEITEIFKGQDQTKNS